MISETHTRYGVRSRCHGKSCRPWRECQLISASANKASSRLMQFPIRKLETQAHLFHPRIGNLSFRERDDASGTQGSQSIGGQLKRPAVGLLDVGVAVEHDAVALQIEGPGRLRRLRTPKLPAKHRLIDM